MICYKFDFNSLIIFNQAWCDITRWIKILIQCKLYKTFSGTLDRPFADDNDKEFLIKHVKKYFDIEDLSYISSWSGVRALLDSSSSSTKSISRGHFVNVIEDGFVQIAGGKLTGFRLIAQEALQKIYNKNFDLKKLKFVDDIINLSETYKEDEFEFTVKHYCVAKPTDYLLRRTHASWFNENGDIKNLKKITDNFYSKTCWVCFCYWNSKTT